jgi:phage tail sheath protein FI
MAITSYPGVYVEEVSSGVRPISAASTSTPAFLGVAAAGPLYEATRITNWTEFQRLFGSFMPGSYLAYSIFAFFNNGGQQCYVVRVANEAHAASITLQRRGGGPGGGLRVSARSQGVWGNRLYVTVDDGTNLPSSEFKLTL